MTKLRRVVPILLGLMLFTAFVASLIWVPRYETASLRQQWIRQQRTLTATPNKPLPGVFSPSTQISQLDVFNAEDRARQTLATILAGSLVLVGAYMTWRTTRATEKNAEIAARNTEIAFKNAQIAEVKQVTDRFTAAVTNLSAAGDDKMALRLGGIYALERIAYDSPEDHWTVMEVLTAYVRDKRPHAKTVEEKLAERRKKEDEIVGESFDSEQKFVMMRQLMKEARKGLPTDIQAALTVIGRRNITQDNGRFLDLEGVDLSNSSLAGADLRSANLRNADLSGADMRKVSLQNAWLCEANVRCTDLTGACLSGAELLSADFTASHLVGADLAEADMVGAYLSGARLDGVRNLTQKQLDHVMPNHIPASLPPGLHARLIHREEHQP